MQQASLALAARASESVAPIAVRAEQAVKVYGSGDTAVHALDGVDVAMPAGRWTAIMGPSGSGKSTLMHCLAGLDALTSGRIIVGGVDLHQLSDRRLTKRYAKIGFVFQSFNLVPTLKRAREHHAAVRAGRQEAGPGLARHGRSHRRSR
jgi:putative ABC transport system ATP-binding protein